MSIEHENITMPPVGHEQSPDQEVQTIRAQEEVTALSGLSRFITEERLGRAEKKLEKLESNDHVIRHAPTEAQSLRGFGTVPPQQPEDKPIGFVQRTAFRHRSRQVEKRRKQQRERYRISQIYNEPRPAGPRPNIRRSHSGTAAAERWNKAADKLERLDRGTVASFDLTKRMSRKERRTQRKAQSRYSNAGWHIENIDERLQKGSRGDTKPGERRKRRIEKQQQKVDRLRAKSRGEPYEVTRTERLLRTTREIGRRALFATVRGAQAAARGAYILGDRYIENLKTTVPSYREGRDGTVIIDNFAQRQIDRVARAAGRKYQETVTKSRGQGGYVVRREAAPAKRPVDTDQKRAYPPRPSKQRNGSAASSMRRGYPVATRRKQKPARTEFGKRWQQQQETNRQGVK